ncbi:uncharacterized protein LOC105424067 [Pogonomyrmex barbatus]|uniref:Uncharacterized protein LOC105424067 n=1 Tax=Pogonomyrmex barbatus TaxID=144034 RepID=A0A6I9VW40_9HYME|nr:uncharacterized protein LOC105424067 [Pogonomyrmex barbatus]
MAWPAATTLTSLLVLLLMTFAASISSRIIATTQAPFGRILKAVKVHGGYMEVIQEQRCSHGLLRLTCRSLKAFIFILEAEYHANHTEFCQKDSKSFEQLKMWKNKGSTRRWTNMKELKGNYIFDDEDDQGDIVDIRSSLNKRCSGQKHCRYNATIDHPGAHSWSPGGISLKYACIPEAAVRRYCNQEVKVIGEGGYINTPGYPLYYIGETCGWTFRTFPGQRIILTFYDLDIRAPDADGNCVDIVRVRDHGRTLFEFCGTAAGTRVVSNSNVLTLDFVASERFYNARGFLLQYQVLGCPEISAPNGSYVSNGTLTSRTFLCKSGSVFPDSRERKRTLECRNGKWNETTKLPGCVATSAVIVKTENEHHHLASLSGDNILGTGVRIGRGEDAVASGSINPVMDSAQSAMMKQADYVVDIVLPTVLIALLFIGNAIIVYIIFQFRKRKLSATTHVEEMALRGPTDVPNV